MVAWSRGRVVAWAPHGAHFGFARNIDRPLVISPAQTEAYLISATRRGRMIDSLRLSQSLFNRPAAANSGDDANAGWDRLVLVDHHRHHVRLPAVVLLRDSVVGVVFDHEGCRRTGDIVGSEADVSVNYTRDT